jgi:AGCS family alanine or glycine:cation symporter
MPGIQASSITSSFSHAFGLEPWQTTVPLVILYGIIIFGGIKRISHVAEWVIPFMAIGYLLIALVVIVFNIHKLPGVLQQIVMGAFGLDATFAGILGSTISWGIKRGVYSNEAGQGSGPHAAGAAEVDHPAEQGLVQALSVYIDTLLVCSATGFMILLTGTYNVVSEDGDYIVNNIGAVDAGPIFSQMAVDRVFAGFGSPFVAISLFFFAFTTMLSYYYNAETNLAYLFHRKKHYCWTIALRVSIISIIVLATFHPSQLAWALGDLGIGLCAWFNLIAIILLGKVAFRILDDYEQRLSGSDPMSFDPVPFGVSDDSQVWTAQKSERKL